jgi:hypothetical protein
VWLRQLSLAGVHRAVYPSVRMLGKPKLHGNLAYLVERGSLKLPSKFKLCSHYRLCLVQRKKTILKKQINITGTASATAASWQGN